MALTKMVNGKSVEMSAEEEAAIRAEWAADDARRAEAAKDIPIDKRKADYPDTLTLLSMLWDAIDQGIDLKTSEFYKVIKAINDKYPKSTEVTQNV